MLGGWHKFIKRGGNNISGAALAVLKWSSQEVGVVGCGFSIIVQN